MRVLALDTSLGATAAAIIEFPSGHVIGQQSVTMERGHAEALVPMVRDLMAGAGVAWKSLDRIITTVGPGSFTGLRVAVAAARAFALAHRLPVIGVSTLTAYAAPLLAGGSDSVVASAIDARHGSVFFERFSSEGKVATPPGLVSLAEAVLLLKGARSRITGNAAAGLHEAAQAFGYECTLASAAPAPDIAWVARLGAAADPLTAPALPLYLRQASATPQTNASVARSLP